MLVSVLDTVCVVGCAVEVVVDSSVSGAERVLLTGEAVLGVPRVAVVAPAPRQRALEPDEHVEKRPTANDSIVQLAKGDDGDHRVTESLQWKTVFYIRICTITQGK